MIWLGEEQNLPKWSTVKLLFLSKFETSASEQSYKHSSQKSWDAVYNVKKKKKKE